MTTYYHYLDAPIGTLLLAGSGDALTLLGFPSGSMARRHEPGWQQDAGPFRQVCEQLQEYFAGERQAFELPLAPAGTTFQQQVWSSLQAIPFGETWSYGQLEARIDRVARSGGGRGQWPESHPGNYSLPPGNRRQWQTHRLWRRARHQALSTGPGIRGACAGSGPCLNLPCQALGQL